MLHGKTRWDKQGTSGQENQQPWQLLGTSHGERSWQVARGPPWGETSPPKAPFVAGAFARDDGAAQYCTLTGEKLFHVRRRGRERCPGIYPLVVSWIIHCHVKLPEGVYVYVCVYIYIYIYN